MSGILILGSGYTGSRVGDALRGEGHVVHGTARSTAIRFDLNDRETWGSLPGADALVWTFPAEPVHLVQAFLRERLNRVKRLIVLGTTSSYMVKEDGEEVTEQTPLREELSRVQGENILEGHGAVILRPAGIYGPNRNPLDWIRRGLVADSSKLVNLVHVDDLVAAIRAALSHGRGSYIVSDGTPRTWKEVIDWGVENGFLHERPPSAETRPVSRRLINKKLLGELLPQLKHADLWQELRVLEVGQPRQSDRPPSL
jgi:nucleoside-diphosphate-sugar epimerase